MCIIIKQQYHDENSNECDDNDDNDDDNDHYCVLNNINHPLITKSN